MKSWEEETKCGVNMGIALHMHSFNASFALTRDLLATDVLFFLSLCLCAFVNFMVAMGLNAHSSRK